MSDYTQTTNRYLNPLTLGVLISTPRSYVDIQNAVNHFRSFIENEIDEPIVIFYHRTDANALQISKAFKGKSYGLSDKDLLRLSPNSTFVLFYHHGFNIKTKFCNEILCNILNTYTFDTKLKANYVKS